jgi:hypothetical protein
MIQQSWPNFHGCGKDLLFNNYENTLNIKSYGTTNYIYYLKGIMARNKAKKNLGKISRNSA